MCIISKKFYLSVFKIIVMSIKYIKNNKGLNTDI